MKIEVWSDFVCPFCYIGKRRMEEAIAEFPQRDQITVDFKSYQLAPEAEKKSNKNIHQLLADKYGMSLEKAKQSNEEIGRQAKELGLEYNFDSMKPANTFDAHRLLKFAAKHGKGNEVAERLFKAYFTESKLISDHHTLMNLVGDMDLDKEEVETMLETNKCAKQVREDEELARELGVQGVPFFVLNEKYAISGAQPLTVFIEVLNKVWEEERKQNKTSFAPKNTKTTYCTGESCN